MSATVVGGDLEMKTPAKDRQSLAPAAAASLIDKVQTPERRDSHRRRAHEARRYERLAIGAIPSWMEPTDDYVIADPGWQHYRIEAEYR
jgi:hypothetical protein